MAWPASRAKRVAMAAKRILNVVQVIDGECRGLDKDVFRKLVVPDNWANGRQVKVTGA